MARHITDVQVNGRTYYISQSELDIPGESDQLYYDTKQGGSMNKMPSKYILRKGEVLDYFTSQRVSKYDLAEAIAND
jgi:hypothetical protein